MNVTFIDLAWASALVLSSAVLSAAFSLEVHRGLLWSALRMTVQLLLIGTVLRFIFAADTFWSTGLMVVFMLFVASWDVNARQKRRFTGLARFGVGSFSVALSTVLVVLFGLATSLRPTPWYAARYAIPLVGIVLGTALNATSLTLQHVFDAIVRERSAIEARLALGAPRREAFSHVTRGAVRAGVLPVINQMAAAGVVTLPGTMTGQMLAGLDPANAARTQILLMLLLAGAGFFSAFIAVQLAVGRLSDDRQRLRLDHLKT